MTQLDPATATTHTAEQEREAHRWGTCTKNGFPICMDCGTQNKFEPCRKPQHIQPQREGE